MLALPPFVLRVTLPMIGLIVARAGNLIVVQPAHPSATVVAMTGNGRRILRSRYVDPDELYAPLVSLTASGVLVFARPQDAGLLSQLQRSA